MTGEELWAILRRALLAAVRIGRGNGIVQLGSVPVLHPPLSEIGALRGRDIPSITACRDEGRLQAVFFSPLYPSRA